MAIAYFMRHYLPVSVNEKRIMDTTEEALQAIKALLESKKNNLSTVEIAERLGKGATTINKWKREQTVNALGIPFCEHYHWTNQGGITYFGDRCDDWLRNDPQQVEDFTKFRQTIFKLSKKPKINLAS